MWQQLPHPHRCSQGVSHGDCTSLHIGNVKTGLAGGRSAAGRQLGTLLAVALANCSLQTGAPVCLFTGGVYGLSSRLASLIGRPSTGRATAVDQGQDLVRLAVF